MSNHPWMAEPMLAKLVTLTKKIGNIQNVSVCVLILAAFSKVLQDTD